MDLAHDTESQLPRDLDAAVRAVRSAHADAAHPPLVAEIRYTIDRDWTREDAIHFLIIVRDRADGHSHPIDALLQIQHELYDHVRRVGTMPHPVR